MVKGPCECVLGAPLNLLAYRVAVFLYVAMDEFVNEALSLDRKIIPLEGDMVVPCAVASASSVHRYV